MTTEIREAIVAELERNEFRAGEFHEVLGRKYGFSAWTIRMIAARAKRERG